MAILKNVMGKKCGNLSGARYFPVTANIFLMPKKCSTTFFEIACLTVYQMTHFRPVLSERICR